jgi:hypothetical protein
MRMSRQTIHYYPYLPLLPQSYSLFDPPFVPPIQFVVSNILAMSTFRSIETRCDLEQLLNNVYVLLDPLSFPFIPVLSPF